MHPTFERWQMKNNPKFPPPEMVKKEIVHMCKGIAVAILCPAFTLVISRTGHSQGYCGASPEGASPLWLQAVIIFGFTDFYEYCYHWIGHRYTAMWEIHRHHHKFFNPTPFAVIADEWADQFVRTWPMIILPLVMPINMDLLFAVFATLFYGYGVYLHWGYESKWLTAHNPIFNTAYHHYKHHAISAMNKPIFTGFFFKIWDNLCNTGEPGKCDCFLCRPARSLADWKKEVKPDYTVLLSLKWWMTSKML